MRKNSRESGARRQRRTRRAHFGWCALVGAFLLCGSVRDVCAQSIALARAMQSETTGDMKGAAAGYKAALANGDVVQALLGLERVFAQLGWNDSIVPIVD